MKKILLIILLSFILFGCKKDDSITIIVPYGSPKLAQLYLENSDDYKVDVVNGADPLVAAFGSSSHDVIFAPTNLGAKMYQSKDSYQLLATIVWGNYYLVSSEQQEFNISSLDGKSITVFGKNQTSDIVLTYLFQELDIDVEITYVDSVSSAAQLFLSSQESIVLLAEPVYSNVMNQLPQTKTIDIQELYQSVTGKDSYPQSGVFIKRNLEQSKITKIQNDLMDSIEKTNQYPSDAAQLAVELQMGLTSEIIASAILNSNLRYVSAKNSKEDIVSYFGLILSMNPALIGGQLPNDLFYYGD
jgi:NitT/TauT family transport system substrate-binding protein